MIARFLVMAVANGLALVILAELRPQHVGYASGASVVVFGLVAGLLNALLRPVLQLIALPLTCLTLGLFALVVNAAVFYLAAVLSSDVRLTVLGAAIGAIVAGVLNGALDSVLGER